MPNLSIETSLPKLTGKIYTTVVLLELRLLTYTVHQVLSHYLQVLRADVEAGLLVGSVPGITDHIKLVGVDEDEV